MPTTTERRDAAMRRTASSAQWDYGWTTTVAITETALPAGMNYLIRASSGAAGTTDIRTLTNGGVVLISSTVSYLPDELPDVPSPVPPARREPLPPAVAAWQPLSTRRRHIDHDGD